ncbi:tRNA (adenosine(37)-N6)-threonylcarbamoyltransferase complex ATPase subunit type 1 TsaE [Lamprobacter modestohalophilus]|uniref:tRNA threonylcarbamoyladenosine biosynthesis protein TsaE n=1 Tax=Lamprobacter modestohalophilus TaxID=1064514 RepID=A0A9X0W6U5_9GAMM|nr:tRNA (adenosine(37)-N6)-threonylcarbamoyltransferase complex ATPase subunit type 1 TsaE [Lamprobacter modestohalophilus]MBK1617870.1 tRNA (adenosine(37)-N6)-threonylcarbamoyltransferase complex ATPase subunit type 1 TsaE [Lamprobacter modestohalophilus]
MHSLQHRDQQSDRVGDTSAAAESPAQVELEVAGETAQLTLGARLATLLRPHRGIVYLRGDLGAGKTTLVRGLLRGLGYQGAVRSPTYTLIEPYDAVDPPVVHLDLYRLADPEELDYLGLRDLLERPGLILIEWPERGAGALPPADLELLIEHAGDRRRIRLNACPNWTPILSALADQAAALD